MATVKKVIFKYFEDGAWETWDKIPCTDMMVQDILYKYGFKYTEGFLNALYWYWHRHPRKEKVYIYLKYGQVVSFENEKKEVIWNKGLDKGGDR